MRITLNKFELPVMGDERMELIEERFGAVGFAVVVKLLARIYGTGGYFCAWSDAIVAIVARSLRIEPKEVSDVVVYAVDVGLFDGGMLLSHGVLTSASVQAQYFRAVSRRSGVTYDPELMIGEFYRSARRAVPFKAAVAAEAIGSVKVSAVGRIPEKEEKKASDVAVSEPVGRGEEKKQSEAAVSAADVLSGEGLDPIAAMQCRRMFAKGKTVPLAALVEITGAESLTGVFGDGGDGGDIPLTAEEVCTPEEAMEAMLAEDGGEFVKACDTAGTMVDEIVSSGGGAFVRDERKPRRDKVYGRYFNVLLDDDEYADLAARIPDVNDYIQRLSCRLLDKDFTCRSAYDAIIDCHEKAMAREGKVA